MIIQGDLIELVEVHSAQKACGIRLSGHFLGLISKNGNVLWLLRLGSSFRHLLKSLHDSILDCC